MSKTHTKGNVIVEDIKVGDIHYEFGYGMGLKVQVISSPEMVDGAWQWKSKFVDSDKTIDYMVTPGFSHYGPNLYDHEAYFGCKIITK